LFPKADGAIVKQSIQNSKHNTTQIRAWFDEKCSKTDASLNARCNTLDNKMHDGLQALSTRLEDKLYKREVYTNDELQAVRQKQERQVAEWDEAVKAIHRAILGLSKDKSLLGSNIVVPLPEWDRPVDTLENGAKEAENQGNPPRKGSAESATTSNNPSSMFGRPPAGSPSSLPRLPGDRERKHSGETSAVGSATKPTNLMQGTGGTVKASPPPAGNANNYPGFGAEFGRPPATGFDRGKLPV
jgi:hypothetical protein